MRLSPLHWIKGFYFVCCFSNVQSREHFVLGAFDCSSPLQWPVNPSNGGNCNMSSSRMLLVGLPLGNWFSLYDNCMSRHAEQGLIRLRAVSCLIKSMCALRAAKPQGIRAPARTRFLSVSSLIPRRSQHVHALD